MSFAYVVSRVVDCVPQLLLDVRHQALLVAPQLREVSLLHSQGFSLHLAQLRLHWHARREVLTDLLVVGLRVLFSLVF